MEWSGERVRRLGDKPITEQEQLAAACTVYPYEAAQILGARQKGNINEVPDREWFTKTFTFSPYVRSRFPYAAASRYLRIYRVLVLARVRLG